MNRSGLLGVVGAAALVVATLSPTVATGAATADPFEVAATAKHSYTLTAASDQVGALWRDRTTWAGKYAADIQYIYPGDGELVVLVSGNSKAIHDSVPAAVRPFVKVVHGGVADLAGSPDEDLGGWTGGNWLDSSRDVPCTLGFAWRRWNGGVFGSTAKHCQVETTDLWYHNDRYLGNAAVQGTGDNDVVLLSPAPNTSFNASIWVHLSTGGFSERTVTGAAKSVVGDKVAYTGRRTLGGLGTVKSTNGKWVWTDANTVRPGDSGGPVFTTYTNGTVQARGTLIKLTFTDYNKNGTWESEEPVTGMIFVDATYTSADLKASIYTP